MDMLQKNNTPQKIPSCNCGCGCEEAGNLSSILPAIISFILLVSGMIADHLQFFLFTGWIRIVWYVIAYLPVGIPVIKEAIELMRKGDIFTEFSLMAIATLGAFAIEEFPEAVAVMLFYSIGEFFQELALRRAKSNIKDLIDQRPDTVTIIENGKELIKEAKNVSIGSVIQLKPGEKAALDGILLSEKASFNTSALTGESKPDSKSKGDSVLAGMINLNTLAEIEVNTPYADSKLSKILDLVQNAGSQKAPTELFIRRFSHYYTPAVVSVAVVICFLPWLFVSDYSFTEWLYKSLIFLVISCPCALVISIPLSYFGGIGAGSRNGILFKGGNYLDSISSIQNVILDKTGTLTKGVFKVQKVVLQPGFEEKEILRLVNALESKSTHPVATAIHEYAGNVDNSLLIKEVEEISGHGLKGNINGKEILAGNLRLLEKFGIEGYILPENESDTIIAIAVDKYFAGYISIADELKEDAGLTVNQLKELKIKTILLSGDKDSVVQKVAKTLGIDSAYGNLLPEDKVEKIRRIRNMGESVAFAGDGVNDAPVIAISDVGFAMGGLGSDAAIETADVVIQDDKPSKIPLAIIIGKETKRIVWQNIFFVFFIKLTIMALGASGEATMWEAVFADVGVALLAILNAMRILHKKFN